MKTATKQSTQTHQADSLARLRNIGLIAHIDAGKTSVSERILYITARSHRIGEVHDGQATMDYLEEERQRGITITSAATTFEWRDSFLNLIDTPGHVDFTAEVERSLRVLDGAVVIFDAVSGVEAQSETVWRQADRHGVPRIALINKMDRTGADFDGAMASIKERLGARPVALNIPLGAGADFGGVIDLISQKVLRFHGPQGEEVRTEEVPENLRALVAERREALIEVASEMDDEILEKFLEGEEIEVADLCAALRRATIQGEIVPTLAGAALKNIGVQPMLDAVIDFLPAPIDLKPVEGMIPGTDQKVERPDSLEAPFAALAFKTISDPNGDLTFIRVYSGSIESGQAIWNSNKGKKERASRIYRMHADKREQLATLEAGDIAALVGLKNTFTGDTLCDTDDRVIL
jgi:elongation factor G